MLDWSLYNIIWYCNRALSLDQRKIYWSWVQVYALDNSGTWNTNQVQVHHGPIYIATLSSVLGGKKIKKCQASACRARLTVFNHQRFLKKDGSYFYLKTMIFISRRPQFQNLSSFEMEIETIFLAHKLLSACSGSFFHLFVGLKRNIIEHPKAIRSRRRNQVIVPPKKKAQEGGQFGIKILYNSCSGIFKTVQNSYQELYH